MAKTLGLDLGTNSIGWAIVNDSDNGEKQLQDKGVCIFQDGVAHGQSGEKPACQDRTEARARRKHYARRRLRKIELLKLLVEYGWCPYVPDEAFYNWRYKKSYPMDPDFLVWQRTAVNEDKNPYLDRYRCLTETLNLETKKDKYALGRALYHICQRRGFLSNRKDASSSDDGVVKTAISSLSEDMKAAGCKYLGEYFYILFQKGDKIRKKYTSRLEHYKAEFDTICDKQRIPEDRKKALERAIFYQRDLKSQKGQVGKCTFEKNKSRCPVSHPRFEEFRMLQFVNSIKMKGPEDESLRPLSNEERIAIYPKFFRKSKPTFSFDDIAKQLAGKSKYGFKDDAPSCDYIFNFRPSTTVSGCPVLTALLSVINGSYTESWAEELSSIYILSGGKSPKQIVNDIWHALFFFNDDDLLSSWLKKNLQLDDDTASVLVNVKLPQSYASLSLKAIDKILPFLRRGYRYDEAVFLANVKSTLPKEKLSNAAFVENLEENVARSLEDHEFNPTERRRSKEQVINDIILETCPEARPEKLYHPSMIEVYQKKMPDINGEYRLGSPRTNAFRNPMAMRALFRLRALLNQLMDEGKIDRDTIVNIEFARGLNDSNMRKAIEDYQRDQEKMHRDYAKEIASAFKAETGKDIEPTGEDILKYQLWKEQNHKCLYTGKQIALSDFLGADPKYDFEHTIPRSRGGDNSQMNKTLCEKKFNRDVKKAKIPSQLSNYEEIMAVIESLGWKEMIDNLTFQIDMRKKEARNATTKSAKDNAIRRAHYLKMKRDYLSGKYMRFTMQQVPEGFSNRQGVDIGIIGKYAKEYLKTVFEKVFIVKGSTTADFRKMWALQKEFEKKERVNHVHHCIDAITIACIGYNEYRGWSLFNKDEERYHWGEIKKPQFPKPWPTFTEDVLAIADEVLVSHHTPDNMFKKTKKHVRERGIIQRCPDGRPMVATGDTARRSLHLQSFYGAIKQDGEVLYVIRKSIDSIEEKDISKIVDPVVRAKVQEAVDMKGLKKAVSDGIWMNEEKGIPIKKVRIKTSYNQLIPLKKQRDLSEKEYKQQYYVANDGNYCMAIYGTTKRSFKIVNNLVAAKYVNGKNDMPLVPERDNEGRELAFIIKQGTMVLFYEKSPEELMQCTTADLKARLYKVTGISTSIISGRYYYGMINLVHHQEARAQQAPPQKGLWKKGEEYRPRITVNHNQTMFLVEGIHFNLSVTGEISFI